MKFNAEQAEAHATEIEKEYGATLDKDPTNREVRRFVQRFTEKEVPCVVVFIDPETGGEKYCHNLCATSSNHDKFESSLTKVISAMTTFITNFLQFLHMKG